MAWENDLGVSDVGQFLAGVDLSSSQFCIVALNASMQVVLPSGQGVRCFGVLQNAPASGEAAVVRRFGVSRVVAGDVIALAAGGALVTAIGTTGKAGAAASGDYITGFLVEAAAADGNIAAMMVNPSDVPLA